MHKAFITAGTASYVCCVDGRSTEVEQPLNYARSRVGRDPRGDRAPRSLRQPRQPLHGFTLIELLVVVTIIALLVSILLPAVGRARYAARIVKCMSNQKQVYLGVTIYTSDNHNYYPSDEKISTSPSYPPGSITIREDMKTLEDAWGKKGYDLKPLLAPYFPGFPLEQPPSPSYILDPDVFCCPLCPMNRPWPRSQYAMFFNCTGGWSGSSADYIGQDDGSGRMRRVGESWQYRRTGDYYSLFMCDFVNTPSGTTGARRTNHHEFQDSYGIDGNAFYRSAAGDYPRSSGVFTGIDGAAQQIQIPAGIYSPEFLNNGARLVGPGGNYAFGNYQVIPLEYRESR
ncbi:MAG: prepilin-type N-terminal cleavage/methylation domain-containing protein [Phycisphaera sp.]|nr:prepilin-type N-terminal cleavage/methylation domain-containing protein [Phycisphaera sp.]